MNTWRSHIGCTRLVVWQQGMVKPELQGGVTHTAGRQSSAPPLPHQPPLPRPPPLPPSSSFLLLPPASPLLFPPVFRYSSSSLHSAVRNLRDRALTGVRHAALRVPETLFWGRFYLSSRMRSPRDISGADLLSLSHDATV